MFGISLSGKAIAAIAVALVVALLGWWAVSSYNELEDKLKAATSQANEYKEARDAVLGINAGLNNELIKALKEASDKELINKQINEEQGKVKDSLSQLGEDLKDEIAKRRLAEAQAGGASTQCYDPRPKPPEVDITWKAYCSVTADPQCTQGSKAP